MRSPIVTRFMIGGVLLWTLFAAAPNAVSHLNGYTAANGTQQLDRWPQTTPVVWNLNVSRGSNIAGSRSVADVIQAAFQSWISAPNTLLSVQRGTDSSKTSSGMDDTDLICFVCSGDFTSEEETLAITLTSTAIVAGAPDGRGGTTQFAGQILDADILFNPRVSYSSDPGGAAQDLQTVATHEIGHFFGLAHSAVVRAVMFPYSPNSETRLSYDDVAGISATYPKATPDVATGSIAGSVRLGGKAIFGAHVFADSTGSGEAFAAFNVRKTPIGTLTLPDGTYVIRGLPAGAYNVTAEPLDLPVTDDDVGGYSGSFGQSSVHIGFTTRWH